MLVGVNTEVPVFFKSRAQLTWPLLIMNESCLVLCTVSWHSFAFHCGKRQHATLISVLDLLMKPFHLLALFILLLVLILT